MESVKSCIYANQVDPKFWTEAIDNIVYTLNRTCSQLLPGITPYEAYYGDTPSVAYMRPFGCLCFIHVLDETQKKLDPKSRPEIFFGYADGSKGYRV